MLNVETFKYFDKEFQNSLVDFVHEEIYEKNDEIFKENNLNEEKYIDEIKNYMAKDIEFKNNLITKAKELIEMDKEASVDCLSLINKIFKNHQINKINIDIISCILDYIKEKIFKKYLLYIFKVLEHNNFLTTLMEISKDKNSKLDKDDKSNKNDNNKMINLIKMITIK